MSFSDDLNTPTERDWTDVEIALGGNLHTLRFTAVDGLTWANYCDRHPARPGVPLDGAYGYDLRSLTVEIAPICGQLVVDGEPTLLRVEPPNRLHPEAPRVDEWAELFAKIDGQTFRRISDAIWALNEFIPQQAVATAKKALAASKTPSTSRSNSGSPHGGSSAGSRKKPQSTSTTTAGD